MPSDAVKGPLIKALSEICGHGPRSLFQALKCSPRFLSEALEYGLRYSVAVWSAVLHLPVCCIPTKLKAVTKATPEALSMAASKVLFKAATKTGHCSGKGHKAV